MYLLILLYYSIYIYTMEETASSIEDHLLEGLSFKLKPGASYVQSRRSVSFFPQGGNSYSSTGVRVIRISLTGAQGEWLDPATLAVMYTVNNRATGPQQLLLFFIGSLDAVPTYARFMRWHHHRRH